MSTIATIDPAENPKVERRVRKFLKALNSGGGKPLETLSPAEARAVLVNAQGVCVTGIAPMQH
jgi:acetyl esterase